MTNTPDMRLVPVDRRHLRAAWAYLTTVEAGDLGRVGCDARDALLSALEASPSPSVGASRLSDQLVQELAPDQGDGGSTAFGLALRLQAALTPSEPAGREELREKVAAIIIEEMDDGMGGLGAVENFVTGYVDVGSVDFLEIADAILALFQNTGRG